MELLQINEMEVKVDKVRRYYRRTYLKEFLWLLLNWSYTGTDVSARHSPSCSNRRCFLVATLVILIGPLIYDFLQTRGGKPSNVSQVMNARVQKHKKKMKEYLDGYETKFIKQAKPVLKRFELGNYDNHHSSSDRLGNAGSSSSLANPNSAAGARTAKDSAGDSPNFL